MIEVIKHKKELLSKRFEISSPLGFVPTMGNLHEGHIELLRRALQEFDNVVVSIFVNPKQFGPNEDFNKYPRTLEQDVLRIEKELKNYPQKKVTIFAPDSSEEVFDKDNKTKVEVMGLSEILEGAIRPGHFAGVTTVVYQLFKLVNPKKAYFGLKDYQQLIIIQKMVEDLKIPVTIVPVPIVRSDSGLALSSRNQYLTKEQLKKSLILKNTLNQIKTILEGGIQYLESANAEITKKLLDSNWNYLEIRDARTLSKDLSQSKSVVILGVYQFEKTRLLDNIVMDLI